MTESDVNAADSGIAWHGLSTAAALERQGVTPEHGLTSAEAEARRAKFGPNKFAEAAKEPRWQAFGTIWSSMGNRRWPATRNIGSASVITRPTT